MADSKDSGKRQALHPKVKKTKLTLNKLTKFLFISLNKLTKLIYSEKVVKLYPDLFTGLGTLGVEYSNRKQNHMQSQLHKELLSHYCLR